MIKACLPWLGTLFVVAWLDYIPIGLIKSSYFSNGKPAHGTKKYVNLSTGAVAVIPAPLLQYTQALLARGGRQILGIAATRQRADRVIDETDIGQI